MLTVHRAERADVLADVLAGQLTKPLSDPMAHEVVAVPARGVERWLQQQLSLRLGSSGFDDGIAANIDFPSPERLLRQVVLATSEDPEAAEAWYSDALVWPVLRVLDTHLDDPRLSVLRRHLSGSIGRGRRLASATTLAGIFSGYGWQRPGMLAAWAAGTDADGAGNALPEPLRWQAWFWREVRALIGQPHLAEQLDEVVARVGADPAAVDLPSRLAFFGPTRVPEALRAVLAGLARDREVSLFVPHPSDALWRACAEHPAAVPRPRAERASFRPGHPLLAALARDVRELQETLAPLEPVGMHHELPADARRATLLGAVQEGVRRDQLLTGEQLFGKPLQADDSLEVHSCHGPERQVEVLRERLLRLFDDHPGLQPRDVLIMCPDVETFAPLIQAAFDQPDADRSGPTHPGTHLRVRLADRGLRETNEVLDVVADLLDLAADRVRAGDLLGFVAQPAVRRRFGFSDDDLELLSSWVDRSGIRWGVDATQRDRFGMAGFPQGTFATGRDRLLLGVLAEESADEWLGIGLPLEGIESTKIDLVGRFSELVDRLGTLLTALDGRRHAHAWSDLMIEAIDQFTEPDRSTQWQRAQAVAMITDSLGSPGARGTELGLSDLRDLMGRMLAARPTRSNFCTGELTVCTLTPMRSVPHRAVVLLGMDNGAFPRAGTTDGDDILGLVPLIGERNRRDEDRQVFLDAITAAADHLLVFYTGSDPVTGATVPPPVVVSQLLAATDHVLGNQTPGVNGVLTRHTLHAFDERNFRASGQNPPRSYDQALVGGARALAALNRSAGLGAPLPRLRDVVLPPSPPLADVDLAELAAFFKNPTAAFFTERLGVRLPQADEGHREQLDVELDGLLKWKIGDRHLRGFMAGKDAATLTGAEYRRGSLPPFSFGVQTLQPITEQAQAIGTLALTHRCGRDGRTVDVRYPLGDGRLVYGTLGDVFGDTLVEVAYSRLKPEHRMGAWIRLLALSASGDGTIAGAVVVGAGSGNAQQRRIGLPDDPGLLLERLVAIRDAGLRAPLWLPAAAGELAARSVRRPVVALKAVRGMRSWEFENQYASLALFDDPQRTASADELISMAGTRPFAELAAALPEAVSADADVSPAERHFLTVAATAYGPLLEKESQR